MRDLNRLLQLDRLSDDNWINVEDMACIMDLSPVTVRQRRVSMPPPDPRSRPLRWRLGDVRAFIKNRNEHPHPQKQPHKDEQLTAVPKKRGRPTKVDVMRRETAKNETQ